MVEPVLSSELPDLLHQHPQVLPRGNGRCYGDAALNDRIISTLKLNRLLYFNPHDGVLEAESGILLADIIDFILPKGFFLPVTPGTKFITLGGAIAADVHGKNHHSEGCFSKHLISFKLLRSDGAVYDCSRNTNPELFWNTIGSMGLTGILLSARFKLKSVETAFIRQETIKAPNLQAVMDLFEASKDWTYTVAWIDCLKKGKNAGRSILFRGEHARLSDLPSKMKKQPLQISRKVKIPIPSFFPAFMLNQFTVKAFNYLFYNKQVAMKKVSIVDYDTYFYPLDALHNWNHIYGKSGFTQYQFVFPLKHSTAGLTEVLEVIRNHGLGSFLTVLKLFGPGEPKAPNSFPIEGYTLAMDFKIVPGIQKLIEQLDSLVLKHQGRVYRAKDALSKPELSHANFNGAESKFQSLQRQRIEFKK